MLKIKNLLKSEIICVMLGIGMFLTGCSDNLSGPNLNPLPVIDHSKDSISLTLFSPSFAKGKTMTMHQPKVFAYTGLDEVRYLSIAGTGMEVAFDSMGKSDTIRYSCNISSLKPGTGPHYCNLEIWISNAFSYDSKSRGIQDEVDVTSFSEYTITGSSGNVSVWETNVTGTFNAWGSKGHVDASFYVMF